MQRSLRLASSVSGEEPEEERRQAVRPETGDGGTCGASGALPAPAFLLGEMSRGLMCSD